MEIRISHSCLNCEEEIANSSQPHYKDSLGYLLCSKACMLEINEAGGNYDMTDVIPPLFKLSKKK